MDTTLHLHYTLTAEELDEATRRVAEIMSDPAARRRSRLYLLGLYAALLLLLDLDLRRSFGLSTRLLLLAGLAVLFLALPWIRRRLKRGSPSPPVHLEVSATGVTIEERGGRVSVPWSGFAASTETPRLFLLLDRAQETLLIIPKRVLPDAEATTWLRALATGAGKSPARLVASTPGALARPGSIQVEFRLGFPDFLNRGFASWRTRTFLFLPLVLFGLCDLIASRLSVRRTDLDERRLLLASLALFGLVASVSVLGMLIAWRSERRRHGARRLVLSEYELHSESALERCSVTWSALANFMENRWAFFVWESRSRAWHMIPKRAFASAVEIDRCRDLLSRRLRRSPWFCL
jgi:YcxB-like protein